MHPYLSNICHFTDDPETSFLDPGYLLAYTCSEESADQMLDFQVFVRKDFTVLISLEALSDATGLEQIIFEKKPPFEMRVQLDRVFRNSSFAMVPSFTDAVSPAEDMRQYLLNHRGNRHFLRIGEALASDSPCFLTRKTSDRFLALDNTFKKLKEQLFDALFMHDLLSPKINAHERGQ